MAYWTLSWVDLTAERLDDAIVNAVECLKTAVTPFDRAAGELAHATAELLSQPADGALPRLEQRRDWAIENGWIYSASGLDIVIGLMLAASGKLKKGVRRLEQAIAEGDSSGDVYVATWNRIALAEVYLSVLVPTGKAPLGFILKNFGAIVSARLFGARRASALLDQATANKQLDERGIISARIGMDRALLLAHTRQFGLARQHLLAARASAETQDVKPMVMRIDAALAALPGQPAQSRQTA